MAYHKIKGICPDCGNEIRIKLKIEGESKKKKEKKKPTKTAREDIQSVVNHYLKVKGITDKSAIKMNYPRLAKCAKRYLMNTQSDVKLINSKITHAKDYFESKDLFWKLETVGKHWQDIGDDKVNDQYAGW